MSTLEQHIHKQIESIFVPEKFKKHFGKFWHYCKNCKNTSKTQAYQKTCKKCGHDYLVWLVTNQGVPIPSTNNKDIDNG